MQKQIILHNIRSAHNVGSIFRTADGAGVEKIYLSGYTPQPIDRFGRAHESIKKTSLGASDIMEWESVPDVFETLDALREDGWTIVSVEQDKRSVSLYDFHVPPKTVYIFGNEIDGVDEVLLEASKSIVHIPMSGQKESLNVAVAAGIVLFKR